MLRKFHVLIAVGIRFISQSGHNPLIRCGGCFELEVINPGSSEHAARSSYLRRQDKNLRVLFLKK